MERSILESSMKISLMVMENMNGKMGKYIMVPKTYLIEGNWVKNQKHGKA